MATVRFDCTVCGVPLEGRRGEPVRCPACGKRFHAPPEALPAGPSPAPTAEPSSHPASATPAPRPAPLRQIRRSMKAGTSLSALLPFVGALVVARSDEHPVWQKILLALSSVVLGVVLVAGLGWMVIRLGETGPEVAARIDADLESLSGYVRSYRDRKGALPDANAWQASLDSGDPRLIDPWGRPYRYELRGAQARLGTLGRDGTPGGDGPDTDRFVVVE